MPNIIVWILLVFNDKGESRFWVIHFIFLVGKTGKRSSSAVLEVDKALSVQKTCPGREEVSGPVSAFRTRIYCQDCFSHEAAPN